MPERDAWLFAFKTTLKEKEVRGGARVALARTHPS